MIWIQLTVLAMTAFIAVSADETGEVKGIGDEAKSKMDEIKGELLKNIKQAFRAVLEQTTKEIDTMKDVSIVPRLEQSLFETTESYISVLQSIEMVIQDFEKQLFQKKMNIYKNNNGARAKMDGISNYPYSMYYAQNLFAAPVRI